MPGTVTEIDEATKQYRVMRWLDLVLAARRRLDYLRDRLAELDADGDMLKCARPRKVAVRSTRDHDKIGSFLSTREDARDKATAEADALEGMLRDAKVMLVSAWRANAGKADPAFAYVIHRYLGGKSVAAASAAVGVTKWASRGYPRKVAPMVYDMFPHRFPPTMEERTSEHGFGYWEFAGVKPPENGI